MLSSLELAERETLVARDRTAAAVRHPHAGRPRDRLLRAVSPSRRSSCRTRCATRCPTTRGSRRWSRPSARSLPPALAGLDPAGRRGRGRERVRRVALRRGRARARRAARAGNPVEPLVRALRARVGDEHGRYVHRGATSQDILDTAAMLVARDALRLVDARARAARAARAPRSPRQHRGTVMAARTLLQQAVPTTFGYKAAGWLVGVVEARDAARRRGRRCRRSSAAPPGRSPRSATRVGGAARCTRPSSACASRRCRGTRSARRSPSSRGALAGAAGSLAKIARRRRAARADRGRRGAPRPTGGASSTMPHKRNPTRPCSRCACARHARAHAARAARERGRTSTSARRAPGTRSGHALTGALAAPAGAAAARAPLARRPAGRRRADAREPRPASTLSEARRLGIDAPAPEDYLGCGRRCSSTARSRCYRG